MTADDDAFLHHPIWQDPSHIATYESQIRAARVRLLELSDRSEAILSEQTWAREDLYDS